MLNHRAHREHRELKQRASATDETRMKHGRKTGGENVVDHSFPNRVSAVFHSWLMLFASALCALCVLCGEDCFSAAQSAATAPALNPMPRSRVKNSSLNHQLHREHRELKQRASATDETRLKHDLGKSGPQHS